MKIKDCVIGTELFRYVDGAGVFRYIVDGIRSYGDSQQIEVECKTCSHGWQCRLLLAEDDKGRIFVVHMLNNDEDDNQSYWHTNDGFFFVKTSEEAKKQKIEKMVREAKESVVKCKEALKAAEDRLAQYNGLLEGVQE